jgi:hypothetical protein
MAVEPSIPGRRPCNSCGKVFKSKDVQRLRRCDKCKRNEDGYSPRCARLSDVGASIRQHLGDK